MLVKAKIDEHHVRTVQNSPHPKSYTREIFARICKDCPHHKGQRHLIHTLKGTFPGREQSKKVMSLILDTDDHIFIAATTAELRDQLVSMIPASPTEERLVDLAAAVLGCDTLDIILTHG